jgi:two-component system chemotaxis sensor kinase CheA
MTGDANFFAGFMDDYYAECDEHFVAIRRQLLEIAQSRGRSIGRAVLDDLFRGFHSIKGISGMVEFREAELLAHQLENYLRTLRDTAAEPGAEGIDTLIDGVDLLEGTIAARREETAPPSAAELLERLAALSRDAAPASPAAAIEDVRASWRVVFVPTADATARGVNVDSVRAQLRAAGTIVQAVPRVLPDGIAFEFALAGSPDDATIERWRAQGLTAEPIATPAPAAEPPQPDLPARALQPSHVVRVDLTRLDDLMRIVGDMVISRARLDDALARVAGHVPALEWRTVQERAGVIERQLRELREAIVRVRLVPVGEIFRRMPFVVRDLAREQGKVINLQIAGEDTEIDKFLVERMLDPVMHLVRNAVSHGFEGAEERLASGKPAEGSLRLSASGVGDVVVLEITDDGRGIDAAQVAERARAAGLPVPAGPLDDAALLDLICTPGFSTRDTADRASGRGVGMSVVKTTVQELNGSLTLHTVKGEGTRYVIELPLTLSITDALIAAVGDHTIAVPQSAVREVVEIETQTLQPVGRQELAPFRNGVLPIVRLSRVFRLPDSARTRLHVFVTGSGADATGLAVDRILGQREIVVRTMSDALVRVDGVSGATDLGDGRVVLIVDPVALARRGRDLASGVPA